MHLPVKLLKFNINIITKNVKTKGKMNIGKTETNTFINRKRKLRKFYKRLMKKGKKVIVDKYGKSKAEALIKDFWITFNSLIPEMPLIRKDDNLLERQLILQTVYLSIYKTLKKDGEEVDEIWQLCNNIVDKMLQSLPRFIKKIARKNLFSNKEKKREMKSAKISQESNYEEDFKFEYVEGDGVNFDYGINMIQCAACKFYKGQKAEEFTPYVCKTDYLYSRHFGYDLIRTKTIAEDHEFCDFRFRLRPYIS